jgi:hypothetical protein
MILLLRRMEVRDCRTCRYRQDEYCGHFTMDGLPAACTASRLVVTDQGVYLKDFDNLGPIKDCQTWARICT